MTTTIFKVIVFMLLFNISVGIMTNALPTLYTPDNSMGVFYQSNQSTEFTTNMQKVISPSGEIEDAGDQVYRLLDLTIIGFVERLIDTLKQYLYGFVQLLDSTLGAWIASENKPLRDFLFSFPLGVFYTLTTIGYIYGAFYLWTNKDVVGK